MAFKLFQQMVENQFQTKIKAIQCDNGTEYKPIIPLAENSGIIMRFTCPYTSPQNGRAERKHRHIVEMGLTLLAQAKIPLTYWTEAFQMAVYLINRLPTPILHGNSPTACLYNKEPDYLSLKPFGCLCYPCLKPYNSHKLEFHSQKCVYLGPALGQKGSRCLSSTGRIYISRHVVFDTSIFPFHMGFLHKKGPAEEVCDPIPFLISNSHSTHSPSPSITPSQPNNLHPSDQSISSHSHSPNSQAQPIPHTPSQSPSQSNSLQPFTTLSSSRDRTTPPHPQSVISRDQPLPLIPSETSSLSPSPNLPSPISDSPPPHVSSTSSSSSTPPSSLPLSSPTKSISSNLHPMITRAKSGISKPKYPFVGLLTTETPHHISLAAEPRSIPEALASPHWVNAMRHELQALSHNKTWVLVPYRGQKLVDCRWVFKTKFKPDGSILKHKARLVAKGFQQSAGVDYGETFSPVVKPTTIRLILSLAVTFRWEIRQLDVNNAFLNGYLKEEVFMSQPPGFQDPRHPNAVCRLNKAIYGLKQAPRAWFERLRNTLVSWGFQNACSDISLFFLRTKNNLVFILIYVDDILVTGNNYSFVRKFIARLNSVFSLKDLGPLYYFLGLEIYRDNHGLYINQTKYILDLLKKFNMSDSAPVPTPMVTGRHFSATEGKLMSDPSLYRRAIGSLQYLTTSRPDIAYSVNKLSQFLAKPTEVHFQGVKRILRYLKGTYLYGLHVKPIKTFQLMGFTDADWATDIDDRKSMGGYCVYLGGTLVSWCSKKQKVVSRSSSESEYRSLSDGAAEIKWLSSLMAEIGLFIRQPSLIWCDNLSAQALASNPVHHARSKHIEIDVHFIRDQVMNGAIQIRYLPSSNQVADCLTKALSHSQFSYFRHKLGVYPTPSRLRGNVRIEK
ncbi:hypothetical protein QN277_022399 [Acacia crassicarpa]|uniref:Integrase catalytic domain-containing protein n=1 Tax=Acacia crassicarpa TaxID=499986 RepID=A0AAE1JF02_9FABA|nr:hypothetical protein QN277_022399 [Acacia crassicarpa]